MMASDFDALEGVCENDFSIDDVAEGWCVVNRTPSPEGEKGGDALQRDDPPTIIVGAHQHALSLPVVPTASTGGVTNEGKENLTPLTRNIKMQQITIPPKETRDEKTNILPKVKKKTDAAGWTPEDIQSLLAAHNSLTRSGKKKCGKKKSKRSGKRGRR